MQTAKRISLFVSLSYVLNKYLDSTIGVVELKKCRRPNKRFLGTSKNASLRVVSREQKGTRGFTGVRAPVVHRQPFHVEQQDSTSIHAQQLMRARFRDNLYNRIRTQLCDILDLSLDGDSCQILTQGLTQSLFPCGSLLRPTGMIYKLISY